MLVWDATSSDTLAISYRTYSTQEAGKVAENAEDREGGELPGFTGIPELPVSHSFTPTAIGPRSMAFLKDLGRRIAMESGELGSTDFLLQRLCVAVQRELCFCVGDMNYYLTQYILLLVD